MSWQDAFTNYTTGTAFWLSLSHDQASLIGAIGNKGGTYAYQEWRSRTGRNSFIPTFRSLERRGLAEYNPAARFVGMNTPGVHLKWVYRLTPAGEHVLALLRLAGVVDHATLQTEAAA